MNDLRNLQYLHNSLGPILNRALHGAGIDPSSVYRWRHFVSNDELTCVSVSPNRKAVLITGERGDRIELAEEAMQHLCGLKGDDAERNTEQ